MILVDGESRNFSILDEIDYLIQSTEWLTLTNSVGKGLVDEMPNVHGVYHPRREPFVDSCDLILCFGPHHSNTNTFIFSVIPKSETSILFRPTSIQMDQEVFRDLPVKYFIQQLSERLEGSKIPIHKPDVAQFAPKPLPTIAPSDPVSQAAE